MIDRDRISREFAELVETDSPSFGERRMADKVKEKLAALGFAVEEDGAGEKYGSDTGNIYGYLKGTVPGEPILLSAHLDTVEPSRGKQALFSDDGSRRITGTGSSVLGADDVAGIVEILEGVRHLQEEGIPHRDVEVLFSVAEEVYAKGARVFDYEKIRAKEAYVLDLDGEPGMAALRAPSILSFQVTVQGRSSHAGFAPEKGIHAIWVMSRAIGCIPQGHVGRERDTTLNIGVIQGGSAANIVPELVVCKGEIRSYFHEKALEWAEYVRKVFEETAEEAGAKVSMETQVHLEAYETGAASPAAVRFQKACDWLGLAGRLTETFGGSDNNQFAKHGIAGIVLSCGMHEVHSVREYTTAEELCTGAALVAELLQDRD